MTILPFVVNRVVTKHKSKMIILHEQIHTKLKIQMVGVYNRKIKRRQHAIKKNDKLDILLCNYL